ncbi:MAG: AmmeMemoRadiSam system radical SAM enzyme [Propionibacteriaceae bacterium]|nr:AmmeMemoRadiSam system radical SAM enzyme [Propionibacteriaceae bacterium]
MKARYWHTLDDGRVQCDLCPRFCRLRDGQAGFCFVRANRGDELDLTTYGRSSGFCVDPIEKKPLNHVAAGQPILSFGTAGCDLACRFCQNWDMSTARQFDVLSVEAPPDAIVATALANQCCGVAYTYNDPVIYPEYAIDVAQATHAAGLLNVAVTAGSINPEPRADFFASMDAANVDLKSMNPDFYRRIVGGRLEVVQDTLRYLAHETNVWVEVTTLVIPGYNDSDAEMSQLASWIAAEMGTSVPLHLTAFHPSYRMLDAPATPPSTLRRARTIALNAGLKFVYTGNIVDNDGSTTRCHSCGTVIIGRRGYDVTTYRLTADGRCAHCGAVIPGRWGRTVGNFGNRRRPVNLVRHQSH